MLTSLGETPSWSAIVDPHGQVARISLGDDVIAADALACPDLDFGIAREPTDDVQLLIVDDHGFAIGEILVHDPCPSVQSGSRIACVRLSRRECH